MRLSVSTDAQTKSDGQATTYALSRRAFLGAGGSLAAAAGLPTAEGRTTNSPHLTTPKSPHELDTTADSTAERPTRADVPDRTQIDHIEARDVKQVRESVAQADTEYVEAPALGIEPNTMEPIEDRIEQAARNGQIVKLPPGDYLIANRITLDASNWGIVGTGQHPTDVRIHGDGETVLLNQRGGTNIRLENFAMQNGPERGVGMVLIADRDLLVKDVHHLGLSHREGRNGTVEQYNHQVVSLTIQITEPDGIGVVDGFVKRSPTEVGGHAQNDSAFGSWGLHEGTVYVRNARLANGGGDGTTYVSRAPGGWRFTRCRVTNSHMSAFRVGGPSDWVVQCTISISFSESQRVNTLDSSPPGMNGIVWETANSPAGPAAIGLAGGLVDGCTIIMHDLGADGSRGGVCVSGSHGGVVVRNTDIVNHTDRPSCNFKRPGSQSIGTGAMPDLPHACWLENVTIAGSGSGAAIANDGRPLDGHDVCIETDAAVEGLPQSARGCTTGRPSSRPDYVSTLLRRVDPSTLPSGDGAPPVPTVPVGAGSGAGAGAARQAAQAAGQLLIVSVMLVIAIALFAAGAGIGTLWSIKWVVDS